MVCGVTTSLLGMKDDALMNQFLIYAIMAHVDWTFF